MRCSLENLDLVVRALELVRTDSVLVRRDEPVPSSSQHARELGSLFKVERPADLGQHVRGFIQPTVGVLCRVGLLYGSD